MVTTRKSPNSTKPAAKLTPPLAVLNSPDAMTMPADILAVFPGIDCFTVSVADGRIILTPFVPETADDVRRMLAAQGITEQDIADAVAWARSG